jgi:leucyl aminopeptidase
MKFDLSNKPLKEIDADLEIIIVIDKNLDHRFVKDKKLLKKSGFNAAHEETCLLADKKRLYVGSESIKSTDIRPAIAVAIRSLSGTTFKHARIASYMSHPKCTAVLRAMVEGISLGAYTFDSYKSEKKKRKLKQITLSMEEYHDYDLDLESCGRAVLNGQIAANATNYTREIVNTTPDDCYPEVMASLALDLAEENGLECSILKTKRLKKENMNALLAVARASRHKPRVIHLAHKPKKPKAIVSIIGKGLTYDSGGLSLKPAEYMVTMKADKSGGSAVLGILKAVSEMDLPIEVHGFIGAVENMIGGDAYKPDDVLVAKNGKTIEVRNTDAEGRLVLADVLCYAQQEVEADYLFDMATLTGACVVGLGHYTSGVMGQNSAIVDRVLNAGNKISGEMTNRLEFNRYLGKTLKSDVADMSNISNTRYGGAITAGMFLSEFIDKKNREKWAHIDIAGPAFVEHAWGENPSGASGAGVRLMLRLLEKLSRGEAH